MEMVSLRKRKLRNVVKGMTVKQKEEFLGMFQEELERDYGLEIDQIEQLIL